MPLPTDAKSVAGAIASDVTTSVAPQVESALASIAISLNNTILTIVPAVTGTVVPLAIDEVEALIAVLGDIHTIVSSIETILLSLVSTVKAGKYLSQPIHSHRTDFNLDALVLVKPEISIVLSLVMPLVSPVTGFAFSVAGSVTGSQGTVSKLTTAATSVTGVAHGLLSPATGVVSTLM